MHLLALSICSLLAWSAWARGGTVVSLQAPLPWLGLAILVCLALDRWGCRRQRSMRQCVSTSVRRFTAYRRTASPPTDSPPTDAPTHRLTDSPPTDAPTHRRTAFLLLCSGLGFLLLLSLQWWNAGRHLYFHPFEHKWVFSPPPHPGWPSSVERGEAAEMLRWFFPAWALMLALRHASRPAWLAKRVSWFLVVNAGLLAAFGIAQALSGTKSIFWTTPLTGHFFASFSYENHAASYFALLFALAAGMLMQRLSGTGRRYVGSLSSRSPVVPSSLSPLVPWSRSPVVLSSRGLVVLSLSLCALLCLTAMVLSFSRTGLAMTVALAGLAVFLAARRFWGRANLAQRVAAGAAGGMTALTLFFVVASIGGSELLTQLSSGRLTDQEVRFTVEEELRFNLDLRRFLARTAWETFAESPWFGVGGWGYRHFVPLHAAAEGHVLAVGAASAHNDAMQFLCEFGAVGFGLMTAAVAAYTWPLLRRVADGFPSGPAMALAGLLTVLLHGTIDLPFRNPGILYAWLAVSGVALHMDSSPIRRQPL